MNTAVAVRGPSLLGDLYTVFKLRIGLAIALSALAGVAVTPGQVPAGWRLAGLAVAVLLSSAAAGAFNHYVERDLDRRMARTRGRPFAAGRFTAGPGWLLALGALLAFSVGLAFGAANGRAATHVFLGAFVYGVVYTLWLKRRTAWNIVVGGLAGSFAVLAGGAAVGPDLGAPAVVLALVLFLWTPPHFWSLAMAVRADYAGAGVPMLPVVVGDRVAAWAILLHVLVLVILSLALGALGRGPLYMALAALGGGWFLWRSIALVRAPGPARAMTNFHASLGQLGLLLVGAVADRLVFG